MRSRFIVALVVASCSTVLAIGLTAPLSAQQEPSEPCCNIKSINARTRMVTLTDKKTACTFEFQAKEAKDLEDVKVGTAIRVDVKELPATSGPTGSDRLGGAAAARRAARTSRGTRRRRRCAR